MSSPRPASSDAAGAIPNDPGDTSVPDKSAPARSGLWRQIAMMLTLVPLVVAASLLAFSYGRTIGRAIGDDDAYAQGLEDGKGELQSARDEAFTQGHRQGFSEGREKGHTQGVTEGRADGYSDGYGKGRINGLHLGWKKGVAGYSEHSRSIESMTVIVATVGST